VTGRRLLALALGLLVAAWVAATVVVFLTPDEDTPTRADAIVVLAGSRGERLEKGLELVRRDVAPVLVISDGLDPSVPKANRLCRQGGRGFQVICFRPSPYSTRGEAGAIARLAQRRRWSSVVVITSDYHVTRARLLFERCLSARVQAVGAPYRLRNLPSFLVSEWPKLLYALAIERDC
jgi:uncharacterized SAM-binding protein YcdF (DUF218 family)